MAVIYLRHPKHGVKIATMDLEADYDEQNGWERFDPDEAPVQRRGRRSSVAQVNSSVSGHGINAFSDMMEQQIE